MRALVVGGEYRVLTFPQFSSVLSRKREGGFTDVFFRCDGKDRGRYFCLQAYCAPYRHLHVTADVPEGEEIDFAQDASAARGDVSLIPRKVRRVMIEEGVFRDQIAHSLLKPSRIRHVDSMTHLAEHLASCHLLDARKARIAGLFHDCAKRWTREDGEALLRRICPAALARDPAVWHQYTGAWLLEQEYGVKDPDILEAIRHHVDGDCPHPLAEIIYLADKLDPSRGYDSSGLIRLAEKSLAEAVRQERVFQVHYLQKEGKTPD